MTATTELLLRIGAMPDRALNGLDNTLRSQAAFYRDAAAGLGVYGSVPDQREAAAEMVEAIETVRALLREARQ